MPEARLLVDAPAASDWNMAVDESLLVLAGAEQTTTLRFYSWREATLSLGYFQNHAERELHRTSQGCPIVRRATGGGAILHDHELTYSFVTPIGDRLSADVQQLYYAFHETLIEALAKFGLPATLCTAPSRLPRDAEPFLCFQRRSSGDVLIGEHKIAGSAQRRHYGAVLQHGSILLGRSPSAPELPGLIDLGATDSLSPEALLEIWQPLLAERLDLHLTLGSLTETETAGTYDFLINRFAHPEWTLKR